MFEAIKASLTRFLQLVVFPLTYILSLFSKPQSFLVSLEPWADLHKVEQLLLHKGALVIQRYEHKIFSGITFVNGSNVRVKSLNEWDQELSNVAGVRRVEANKTFTANGDVQIQPYPEPDEEGRIQLNNEKSPWQPFHAHDNTYKIQPYPFPGAWSYRPNDIRIQPYPYPGEESDGTTPGRGRPPCYPPFEDRLSTVEEARPLLS